MIELRHDTLVILEIPGLIVKKLTKKSSGQFKLSAGFWR